MAYQPILVEGRIWSVLVHGGFTGIDSIDNLPPTSHYYKVDGDSVIGGETYKKVHRSYNKIDWKLYRLMMENAEEGKVWEYGYSYLNQVYYKDLIINFNLNLGDRLKESGSSVCENIKYVKDKRGNTLKRMDFEEYCWIEGYGYEYYILDGGSYYLSSVEDENGIIIDCSKGLEYYNPMVVNGYRWNVVSGSGNDGTDIYRYITDTEIIDGDSIIDGVVYKKLWVANPLNLNSRRLLALVREDIKEEKVFAYNEGVEVLLYDLGVEVGDTIRVHNCLEDLKYLNPSNIQNKEDYFSKLVVEKIEFFEDENYGKLRKIIYREVAGDPHTATIYERYGATTGWATTSIVDIDGGTIPKMICAFDEMGEVVYKRKYTIEGYGEVKDCYINAEINTNVDTPKKEESVYYNSQNKILHVDFEEDEKIEIYNTMGKRVMRKNVEVGCKSISCNLNAGIYIVTAKNSNTHTKIVVK